MKAEGGAASGGVHANYVAGLVDLGPSRDGMGWITRPPANSFNPNFTSAVVEDFVGFFLHPCQERRKRREGRHGGSGGSSSSVDSATFFR